jgi:hypothetical protein
MSSRHSQQDSWLGIPLSVGYWKVVGIFLVYFYAFPIGATNAVRECGAKGVRETFRRWTV